MTRAAIFSFVIAASTFTGPTLTFAYAEGPWCLKAIIGRAEHNICHFRTFEQCLAERSFYGGQSFCGQNPRYIQYWRNRGQTKYP
jgi:Protein of unknown function (DUF3551)